MGLTKHERLAILYGFMAFIFCLMFLMAGGSYLKTTCGG
ncbi:hypothetical protein BRC2024_KCUCJSVR_CDS_0092 [Acinetobacter phage vB_AbaM_KissB]